MTRRTMLFLIAAIVAGIAVAGAWAWMVSNPVPTHTVRAGATTTIDGTTWHLDWMTEVSLSDPDLDETRVLDIEGATYILAQFTYSGTEPFSTCTGTLLGDGRDWRSTLVEPVSTDLSRACEQNASASVQMVFTVPPDAVGEIRGLRLSRPGSLIVLEGRVH